VIDNINDAVAWLEKLDFCGGIPNDRPARTLQFLPGRLRRNLDRGEELVDLRAIRPHFGVTLGRPVMAKAETEFTAPQVAYLLRESVGAVKKELDRGPIETKLVTYPGKVGRVRAIGRSDVLYLIAIRALKDELTPKARNEFYRALKRASGKAREVRFGQLCVNLDVFKDQVERRTRELNRLQDKVEFRKDGEPVLKGTDLEVYRIAALLGGGMTPDEICKDYPSIALKHVAVAKDYADAHPKTGRPYPSKTVKRAIKGAGLEALDEVLDEEA
jgi:uncharacterized protein (DUF433 family)